MKYKVGDKVKLLEDRSYFTKNRAFLIENNYIAIVEYVDEDSNHYRLEGFVGLWGCDSIECLVEAYKEPIPINSRFELLF